MSNRFQVIRDTREKQGHGWWYDENAYCSGTTKAKVEIGDYAIEGMEHILCIERKESVSELAGNCSEKRFHKELERMSTFPYAFLILEFSWSDIERYPEGSSVPRSKWSSIKIKGKYINRVISTARLQYGIHVIACGDKKRAEEVAFYIMRKVHELQH
jgi:ERCC4-type nuclease|tara:strand:- start:208 stop:681 length:474 start_codon:yes stop_codon:yes gene_type:complete